MKRFLVLLSLIPLVPMAADVQVATLKVREQNLLVREVLAEIITPDRQMVTAETGGVVRSERLEMGSQVTKGQVVVEIESSEQEAILDIARKELASAEVEEAHRRRTLQRAKINRDQKVISEAQFDKVETLFAKAQARLALMKSRVRLQETRLQKYQIRSPITGDLVRSSPVAGRYVRPGDPVFEIVNTDELRIAVQLTPAETSEFLSDRYALFCGNERLRPVSVSPTGEAKTGMTSLEFEACLEGLRPGQHVGVSLVLIDVASVPGKSIQTDEKGKYVYIVNGGIVVRRTLEELRKGESVIVMGTERVAVGDLVNPIALDIEGLDQ
jgi:membrane fusion protein, multidrug efflux system